MPQEETIKWSAHEFSYKEKTADWFWAVVIIIISLSAIAFIYDNSIFSIFLIIAGFTLLMQARKESKIFDFELSSKGIKISDALYQWNTLKNFWIEDSFDYHPKLLIRSQRMGYAIIVIYIETDAVDAEEVRKFLLKHIPEERIVEPLSQKFMEYLGF